jgi:general L-amino acid transport system permease protein
MSDQAKMLPPVDESTLWGWMRKNLFYSWFSGISTFVLLWIIFELLYVFVEWGLLNATFEGADRTACSPDGACWAFISSRWPQFLYGLYPVEMRWRADVAFLLLVLALLPVFWEGMPKRRWFFVHTCVYPFEVYILVWGGWFGLEVLDDTRRVGGFMLTLIVGLTGIALSLPIGIVLALGRRSEMAAISSLCVMFIEFIRGVPLITLLFIASTMLNYFLPPGTTFDLLVRVLIMVTLFASGYMAEVIRGGLQAIPRGQWEGAASLGLGYGKTMGFIILPQVLKISIPGIVNIFISLFKDTTLVVIIGLLDPLGIGKSAVADIAWKGLSREVYVFLAFMFFVFCFVMSRYSQHLERRLDTQHRD